LALKQNRTRLVVITAGAVMLGTCIVLYVLSLLENLAGTEQAKGYYDFVRAFLHVDVSGAARIEEYREVLWRSLYLVTIRMQLLWVLVVVAQVGPGLIAKDLKTKALPIYFAKPVTPITYVAGKWLVVASFIAAVMLLPNLLSLIIGTLVTGGLHTWGQTLGLGADLVLSGLGVCALAGATILALSSFTSDQRYVAVGWLAVCVIPSLAQQVIDQALPADATTGWLGCISLRDNIVVTTERLLGIREAWEESSLSVEAFRAALFKPVDASRAAIVLSVWTVGAFFICYRRVVRFARSAANV
jgi:ABC-type transport system involved in multi-copper enzyme maturation permease subunit